MGHARKRKQSPILGPLALMVALGHTAAYAAQPLPNALPTGGQVTAGNTSILSNGSVMTVNQSSQNTIINWQSFNVGANAAVTFNQPNASAQALNRVLTSDPSYIYGKLSANGQVFFLNPAGILFGPTASVNVGGMVASTLNLSDNDFLAGKYSFTNGGGAGSIVNQGSLTAADGGYLALLAPQVRNEGVITAKLGTVILAAGDKASLDFSGDGLINFSVDKGTLNALVENKNLIQADGGQVIMSAKAADALTGAVVNNEGVIAARTLQSKGGRIMLLSDMTSGEVRMSGTLDASAPNGGDGGFIETSAAKVSTPDGYKVTTLAGEGKTGTWLIDPASYTIAASGGDTTGAAVATSLNTTNVSLAASAGNLTVGDDIAKTGSPATTLTLSATGDVIVNNAITSTGGRLNVVLNADSDNAGGGNFIFGSGGQIKTAGGNFYAGSVTGTDTLARRGGTFTMAAGSSIDAGGGLLRIDVNGNVTLDANSLKGASGTAYTNDGNYAYYSGYGSMIDVNTLGTITSTNAVLTTPDIFTTSATSLSGSAIGTADNPIKISGASASGASLTVSNSVGSSYVNEIGTNKVFGTVNVYLGSQHSATQNIQILGDGGGNGTTGTGHVILNTDASGVLNLATKDVDTSAKATNVNISSPTTITFANNSVNVGTASFTATASTLTSSQVDGTADIKAASTTFNGTNIGTSENPLELGGSGSNASLNLNPYSGGSTHIKVVDDSYKNITFLNYGASANYSVLFSGGDHIDFSTNSTGILVPTISGGPSDGETFGVTTGIDVSRGKRNITLEARTGNITLQDNSVNTDNGKFTSVILNSDSTGIIQAAAGHVSGTQQITAGDVEFDVYNQTTPGTIGASGTGAIEIAKGADALNNTLTVYTYKGGVNLSELTANQFKTLNVTLNGSSAEQNVKIDLNGPDDVNFSDNGSQILIDATKVNLSANNRNWNLSAPSRTVQIDGVALGTGSYSVSGGTGLKLNGDVMTNGGSITLNSGSSANNISLLKSVRIDSNADDTANSASTGASGTISLTGAISAAGVGSSLVVDSSSSSTSGGQITVNGNVGNATGAFLSGLTLSSKGSTNTNDNVIYLYGSSLLLNGGFSSTGNTYLVSSSTIDTEQGNTADGGKITFAGYGLITPSGNSYRFDSSTSAAGKNGGDIDLYGTYNHSAISGAQVTVNASGGAGGSVILPAVSTTQNGANNSQTYTGGIVTLNGNLSSERGDIALNGDVRLANSIVIDTSSSPTNGEGYHAGNVSIGAAGTTVSATAANQSLTINTNTSTTNGYLAGGNVTVAAGNAGGSYLSALTVNTSAGGTNNSGASGSITLNGVTTVGAQTYSGGAATINGNLLTNGGGINLSGVSGLTLSGPTTFQTDMVGGSTAAGVLNLGTLKINTNQAVVIDTTADGGGSAADLTLNAIGDLTPLSSLNVKAGTLTVSGAIKAAGNVTLQSVGSSADIKLNAGVTSNNGNVVLAAGRNFINTAGASALAASGEGNSWQVWSNNPLNDSRNGLVYNFKQYGATYGTTAVAGVGNGVLYTVAPTLTPTIIGTVTKTYDAGTVATLTAANYAATGIDGDSVLLSGPTAGSYDTKNVGNGKTVNVSGITLGSATNGAAQVFGYTLATGDASGNVGTVNAKTITVSGTAQNKVYDGGVVAATDSVSMPDVIGRDDVSIGSANFVNKNVGNGKTVLVTLGGGDAGNYRLSEGSGLTGNITAAPLTITAVTNTKTYDGGFTAAGTPTVLGLQSGDSVTGLSEVYADKNAGGSKTLNVQGYTVNDGNSGKNYSVTTASDSTGIINKATLTITAATNIKT